MRIKGTLNNSWLQLVSVQYNSIVSQQWSITKKTNWAYSTSVWQKPILVHNTFQQPWPLKCYIRGKCSYKVLFPLGPNLWPQFRLREIWGEQGLFACGCACNTQSPHVRLYFFLFHLSIGTCPLHPQISLAWSHYTTVYPFFRKGKGSSCSIFYVFREEMFQNFAVHSMWWIILSHYNCQPVG